MITFYARALSPYKFKVMLKLESDCKDITCHCNVRCFSNLSKYWAGSQSKCNRIYVQISNQHDELS